ncbi:MAG: ABC transporter ATP-binding protein [Proteobacteria bacterium]|nr:ABC transporter ATP-binding protein [Pseudomonadota bacterium]
MNIQIRHLDKQYPYPSRETHNVLKDINLNIQAGDFVTILGKSGCGKSTLLNLIAGLSEPSKGDILLNGKRVKGTHPSIYIVFQQPCLLPWLNVEDNISFGCKLRKEMDNLAYRVGQFIELIGLSGRNRLYPAELSVGMACRVALARALIGRPKALLLDEPFGALDIFTRSRLQEEMINIWMSEQFTAMLVTHDIDEAILMGKKIVILGGSPCRIMDIVENPLPYPRKITDENFFRTKTMVMKKFKHIFLQSERV